MSISPSTAPGYVPPPPGYVPPQSTGYAAGPVVPVAAPASSKAIPILIGAVVALLGATGYLFYQVNNLRTDLDKNQTALLSELDKVRETSAVTTQTQKRNVDQLREQLEVARRQARMAAGDAKVEALKKVEETRVQLEAAQQQVRSQVAEVKQSADTANTKISEVNTEVSGVKTEVSGVKTEVASTKSELDKTISDLKRTQGDLDGHTTLIATNGKELAALRQLGERNYVEFNIHKSKQAQKVGDVSIRLEKADPKRNRYTIELTADDKKVEKKDRTINEPLQFLTSKAKQPYEIVVNDVKKDQIAGYLAIPKVLNGR